MVLDDIQLIGSSFIDLENVDSFESSKVLKALNYELFEVRWSAIEISMLAAAKLYVSTYQTKRYIIIIV